MKIFAIGGIVGESGAVAENPDQSLVLLRAMRAAGRSLANGGHDLLVCSPFDGTCDVEVVRGAMETELRETTKIEFYYPNSKEISDQLDKFQKLTGNLPIVRFPQQPPADSSIEARRNAWLLCQLTALENCNVILAIGGNLVKTMNLLLPLAETRRKPILPLRFLGGAAEKCFERKQYELRDRLGDQINLLSDPRVVEKLDELVKAVVSGESKKSATKSPPTFFLSYAKARPADADFVEMVLRRRNFVVMRDDKDFAPGSPLPSEIRDYIHRADVFIAIWCREYACSPWCFDELDLALDRSLAGSQTLLLFNVDNTRIVPPKARDLLSYPAASRKELEAEILRFLDRFTSSGISG